MRTIEKVSLQRSSAVRPNSLDLDNALTLDMDCVFQELDDNNSNNNNMIPTNSGTRNSRKKRKRAAIKKFSDLYEETGEFLGNGSYASVRTYKNKETNKEYAVKMINKCTSLQRSKVFKEIEIFHQCQGIDNILNLVEYFEEDDVFYLVFDKMAGGTLLSNIESRGHLSELEASKVVKEIARALDFLHKKGIAHRDLKPENILCQRVGEVVPLKICDFDLASGVPMGSNSDGSKTPELLTPVGSAEYMAPEVVDAWVGESFSYDKKCDLWSLGIILYIMVCGYPPFYGQCGEDCGWERGEACQDCQELLFTSIQDGVYDFPEVEWECVSESAKDLVRHLLVRNPRKRYSAQDVLNHPWVTNQQSSNQLATPQILTRNNSTKDLESFAETAISINRMMQQHLIISGVPQFHLGSYSASKVEGEDTCSSEEDTHSHDSDENEIDSVLSFEVSRGLKLSPPGLSSLAKRRTGGKFASTNFSTSSKFSRNQHHPLITRGGSAMGSVDSFCISSGSWQ